MAGIALPDTGQEIVLNPAVLPSQLVLTNKLTANWSMVGHVRNKSLKNFRSPGFILTRGLTNHFIYK